MAKAKKEPAKKPAQKLSLWAQFKHNLAKKRIDKAIQKKAAIDEKARLEKAKEGGQEARTAQDKAIIKKRLAEKERLDKMAEKAAGLSKFVAACKAKNLDPKETFLKYYQILSNRTEIIQKQVIAAIEAKSKGTGFSETVFYANLITGMLSRKKKN